MSRSRRFFSGLSLGYSNQALVLLVSLWLTPFLLKHIGQHDYGLWLVGLQVLYYLMLMDFGIVALLPRETAYATGRAISGSEGKDLQHVVGRAAQVVLYQTPLVALAVVIFWFVMPTSWHEFRGPVTVVMVTFTLMFPLRIFQAVLQGLQDIAFLGRIQIYGWFVSNVLTVGLVLGKFGLYALAIGWAALQVMLTALAFYRLRTHFPEALPSRLPGLSRDELLSSLTSGFWVSVAQVAHVLISGTDFMIIGKFLGPSAVVPFACTQKLLSALRSQPYLIMETAAPGLSQMKTSESPERIFQVSAALTLGMVTIAGLIACVALAVNQSFVNWWLDGSQFGGSLLTGALVACMLLRHWSTTIVYSIFALGYERRISVTTLLDGVVALGSGVVLIQLIGPIGVPLGSILAVCVVSVPGNISALAREGRVSVLALLQTLWPWLWRFVIVATVSVILGLRWRANFPYIVEVTCFTTAFYCALMLPMLMKSHLRAYVPSRATQLWDGMCSRFSLSSAVSQDPVS